MKKFISDFFPFILMSCVGIGFIVPDPGDLIKYLIIGFLAFVIFCSFFQFDINNELRSESRKSIIFTLLRYLVLPFLIYFILKPFSQFYAYAFFIISLLPSGVSSPAITYILKGNFNLSVLTLVLSSSLVLVTIPLFLPLFYESDTTISSLDMLQTLTITIVLPFFLHLPFRRVEKMSGWIRNNLAILSVVSIGLIMVFVVASNKSTIISEPLKVLEYISFSLLLFVALYVIGLYLLFKFNFNDRLSFSVSSGLNNLGLGVALSLIFLEESYTVLFITAEIAWVTVLIPVKYILKQKSKVA